MIAVASFIICTAILTTGYEVQASEILENISAGAGKKISVSPVVKESAKEPAKEIVQGTVTFTAPKEPVMKVSKGNDLINAGAGSDLVEVSFGNDPVKPAAENDPDPSEAEVQTVVFEQADTELKKKEPENDELSGLCIADVENSMNIRREPSEDASLAGYLYKDGVGTVLEQKNGWTKIQSGSLTGWAKDEYLLFDEEAKSRIREINQKSAQINTETLRVRGEANEESEIIALLGEGEEVDVLSSEGDWTKIRFEDGTEGTGEGYVSTEYIIVAYRFNEGETIEEVEKREKISEEKKAAAEKSKKESDNSSDSPAPSEMTAKQESLTNNGAVEANYDDETLLAALIQCECGTQPYEGQLAVGSVVMNRARGSYGSIKNAIYAPYQFGPASSGKLAKTLASGAINGTARQAAKDAISGLSNIGNATHFRNVSSGHAGIVIGSHVFW